MNIWHSGAPRLACICLRANQLRANIFKVEILAPATLKLWIQTNQTSQKAFSILYIPHAIISTGLHDSLRPISVFAVFLSERVCVRLESTIATAFRPPRAAMFEAPIPHGQDSNRR